MFRIKTDNLSMIFLLADVYQAGKVNITDTSQNNHGCQSVSFKTQFQGSGDVQVFVTLSHGNKHIKIHDREHCGWNRSLRQDLRFAYARQEVVQQVRLLSTGSHSRGLIKELSLAPWTLMNGLQEHSANEYRSLITTIV